jgi:uncharacterized membrane protein
MILEDCKMSKQYRDLLVMIVLSATLVWAVNLFGIENIWVRSLLTLPFIFGIGYLVGAAIFPGNQLRALERFLLTLGLGLSILILTGLLLHFMPSGLRAEAWAGILFLFGAIAAGIAYLRREMANTKGIFQSRSHSHSPARPTKEKSDSRPVTGKHIQSTLANNRLADLLLVLALSLSVLIVVISAAIAFMPAPQAPFQGYSLFWMMPRHSSGMEQVELGVRSMEFQTQTYRIELYLGDQLVQQWEDIQLAPQRQLTILLDLDENWPENQGLEARLYLEGQTERPYRMVRLSPQSSINNNGLGN